MVEHIPLALRTWRVQVSIGTALHPKERQIDAQRGRETERWGVKKHLT